MEFPKCNKFSRTGTRLSIEEENPGSKENEWAQQVGKVESCSLEHLICQPLLMCLPGTTWQCLESLLVTGTGAVFASRSQGCCWAGQPLLPNRVIPLKLMLRHSSPYFSHFEEFWPLLPENPHQLPQPFFCSSFLFTTNIPFVLCLH